MNDTACQKHESGTAHDQRVFLTHTARARELQSEVIGNALAAAGRFLARCGAGAVRRVANRIRKRRTITELSRLDDHVLADIGIDRAQIPMIAQGLIASSGESPRRTIPAATCSPEYRGDAANDTKPPSIAA